jgi:poly-gamma-glutamate system protein
VRGVPYNARLVALSIIMALIWFGGGFRLPAADGEIWNLVRSGQRALWERQISEGIPLSVADDRLRTGFIGVEWSALSTTLGDLEAKRASCDPLWAIRCLEWFDELGLSAGDRIAVYSSASFPGLLFSVLAAAESRELEVLLVVSLGASSWGANRAEFPWPAMYRTLSEEGFIGTKPAFFTPGGDNERGDGIPQEGMDALRRESIETGVPLIVPNDLDDAIRIKSDALLDFAPRLMINIGGSNANLGRSKTGADIPPGLLMPEDADSFPTGDGVISIALRSGIPVLHMLNLRRLALENGIPWDAAAFTGTRAKISPLAAAAGLAVFGAVLASHRRWGWRAGP